MKLLFITQKIDEKDDDLAFTILWIKEFINQGVEVEVICLEKGSFDNSFPVYSLGKEKGNGKIKRICIFLKLILSLDYERIFVHMNPEYVTLGGWWWFLRGIPIYLWYTHYAMHFHLWLSGILCKRMFAATAQSLPQYEGNPKKVILGHGIDVDFWDKDRKETGDENFFNLLSVHRISRSKRLELVIQTLKYLPEKYKLTVYGRAIDKEYFSELQVLVKEKKLQGRVFFKGPVPMAELKNVYYSYRIMVNMAPETIDKTILEGMVFGLYPVTTPGNSQAIGLSVWPTGESPERIADFILSKEWQNYSESQLRAIVIEKHSLKALIGKMLKFIIQGN